ncbi:MAG: DNA mismatch repair protein MutL, partial [Bacteroidetes bacterium]|nr:DNA mismatch repair protein MutL [Bacteroidota bacterium]
IKLVLRDAGKELIQVIDNGKGMSTTDARMAFERHATSKISAINDLFSIRTMGFRGEALASVAAVAQVELRTCPKDGTVGTRLVIEATEVKSQEPMAAAAGTNLMIKNLFFNVPARRHFLKSNATELRHALDEFTRVAMAYPQIGFQFWNNDQEQIHLEPGNLKQRIIGLLGHHYSKNLVPVEEDTEFLKIHGFIGKPESASKSRGQQFFFINNRFIKSPFLNHAVNSAYGQMITKDAFPFYVLFLEIDPARVDVNVHPTKQEVKFEDDRLMYAYLQAAVKHGLARYNIAPSLDFSLNPEVQSLQAIQMPETSKEREKTKDNYLFQSFTRPHQAHRIAPEAEAQRWKELYGRTIQQEAIAPNNSPATTQRHSELFSLPHPQQHQQAPTQSGQPVLQVQGSLLVTTVKSGLLLVHLRRAKEKIWQERLEQQLGNEQGTSQRLLFPISIDLAPADATLLQEVLPELKNIGFEIEPFGGGRFVIQGCPAGMNSGAEKNLLEQVLENLKNAATHAFNGRQQQLINTIARNLSYGETTNTQEALHAIIDELFACTQPELTSTGKKVFVIKTREDLEKDW